MDAETLSRAMGGTAGMSRYRDLIDEFNEALILADCTTIDRVAMFCAQVGHESNGLLWMEELASGDAYDTRTDLGNTPQVDGDGRLYKGRGPIQLTGRSNYARMSQWAFDRGLVPYPRFYVDHPELVATNFQGAVWYWTVARDMNDFADRGDIRGATIAVNGGTTHLQDRINRWNHCRTLGPALLPEEDITMTAADDIKGFIKVFLGPVISDVKDIREQLTGSRDLVYVDDGKGGRRIDWALSFKGWTQLGQNPDGSNKTVVDSLADARTRVISLEKTVSAFESRIAALEGKK